MDHATTLQTIERGRIIAIIRGDYRGLEEQIVTAIQQAGVSAVEVTLNSPGALESIRKLANRFGSSMAIGAGTVLKPSEVSAAADAGARFIVSPNRKVDVIGKTRELGLVSLPGCFTPSEIIEAIDAGADAAKLFPASSLGPSFIKSLRGPLGSVRLVPTGGVTPESAAEYFKAGAWAVGVGSELVGPDVLLSGGVDRLAARATAFVAACRK